MRSSAVCGIHRNSRINPTVMDANVPETRSPTQLTHRGTTQPAITTSQCPSKRTGMEHGDQDEHETCDPKKRPLAHQHLLTVGRRAVPHDAYFSIPPIWRKNGCPTWIRTRTPRSRVSWPTISRWGSECGRKSRVFYCITPGWTGACSGRSPGAAGPGLLSSETARRRRTGWLPSAPLHGSR